MILRLRAGSAARAVLLAFLVLVLAAGPAAADAAGPSDYRSEVTGIEPATDGVRAEIVGGDAFLELTVESGTEVVVEGYEGEPYLRFSADGTVEQNLRSPTTYLNADRTGAVDIPADADADAAPEWEEIANGGSYAWHDHRTHWMGSAPPDVDRGEQVGGAYDPWQVPITVDGERAEIQGTLTYADAVSAVPWLVLAVIAAIVLGLVGRASPTVLVPVALAMVGALATAAGWAEVSVSPADAGANPLQWALPGTAVIAAVVALLLHRRPALSVIASLASVATLFAGGLLRFGTLLHPVLPSVLPDWLDRSAVALSLGASVGAAVALLTSGVLALPSLDEEAPAT